MATSTYSDTMAATVKTDWILERLQPGEEYATDPDADNLLRKRVKNVFQRFRYLSGITTLSFQNGQVGVGGNSAFTAKDGGLTAGPSAAAAQGYVCEDDGMVPVEPGANIQKQSQTWIHYGRWESFDPDQLTSSGATTTTTAA
jgi:hypothetical protein